jgi:hypothetical protein
VLKRIIKEGECCVVIVSTLSKKMMEQEQARDVLTNGDVTPSPGEILLRVKSANHPACEDLEFNTKYSSSIRQIKEMIQRLNSQHPVSSKVII